MDPSRQYSPRVDTASLTIDVDSIEDIVVVNYAPTGTSTLSPNTVDTIDDDGITVDSDNASTVDIGMTREIEEKKAQVPRSQIRKERKPSKVIKVD
ncbi:hypothetical protein M9H77_18049 [Catharanthus roseus]|uniref:Uncharacterized protein n=1 Tax=Catharanthus roseus TaxID=4058 RepID=A0ACC0B6C8_CATRO|nr:hypothetical protein M9H77_18049 [Catharanthus roseus]